MDKPKTPNKLNNKLIYLLIILLIEIVTILIGTSPKVLAGTKQVILGGVDDIDTGKTNEEQFAEGKTDPSQFTYNNKPVFCAASGVIIVYRESKSLYYTNKNEDKKYNQRLTYEVIREDVETEQSTAAAYKAYEYYKNHSYG